MPEKSNKEDFLRKVQLKFPENFSKYDYSKFEYINNSTKSTIICKVHGEFQQTAGKHLSGRGCRSCQYEGNSHTTESWVSLILERFPENRDKYNYNLVKYTGFKSKVLITCNTCSLQFKQTAKDHLEGHGCSKCGDLTRTPSVDGYLEDLFVRLPENKNLYDYSKLTFRTLSEKSEILCKMCGKTFLQPLIRHREGAGCPFCNMIGRHACVAERDREKFLKIPCCFYLMRVGDFYKYGISSNIRKRVQTISRQTGLDVNVLISKDLNMYTSIQLETYIKLLLKDCLFTPQDKFGGYTECFKTDEDSVSNLIEFLSNLNIEEGDNLVNLP